ncbi:B-cell receptor CD22-like isoform X2 [Labeo rohita]|uniref:B-cell receptor CD22-like isoform X2 n=1 Tax=Labeo rohita TaxID=84645 RepID=UPI0021E1D9C1|nr:B-cell receptor CD22-like isoform X2 [Labeo rohita]
MSVRTALPLMILLMIHGVYGQYDWGVTYSHSYMCALKDSSVTMTCFCTFPPGYWILNVFWTKTPVHIEPLDLSNDPEYSRRVYYWDDLHQYFHFQLSRVTLTDSNLYYCRITTNVAHGNWIGDSGVLLAVTDLQVESPERVTEGDSVRLTCKSSCTLTDRSTFIWFRNSQPLTTGIVENKLDLWPVRREDAGSYSCSVYGHSYISPVVYLSVTYAPVNPVISISPSGEIVEGDSVTLNCSSDSNPPAEINWFKGGTFVGSQRIYSISKISSDHSGEYKCKSRNKHGEKLSNAVTLNVMYSPRSVSVSISSSGEIVEGDSMTLICSSDSNPPAEIIWFKGGTFVGSGRIYSISKISSDHSGEYKCKARNKYGEKYSDTVTLSVMYPPKNVLVSVSGEITESDSVTLTCSSDSNPPALNFIWFKEDESSSVGSGQSFSALQSGRFYCEAHNQHGSQRSDAVTVTGHRGAGWNVTEITVASGGVFIIIVIIIILFIKKMMNRRPAIHEYENDDLRVNKYMALEPRSRSSDQYNTLTTVHPRPAVHQSGSSEYENQSPHSEMPQ